MKLIHMDEDAKNSHLVSMVEFEGSLIALYLFDVTEINRYIRENQEQRMAAASSISTIMTRRWRMWKR